MVVEAPPPEPVKAGPAPRLLNPGAAPALTDLLKKVSLRYDSGMTQEDRDRDFGDKIVLAHRTLKLERIKEMRERSLDLIEAKCGEISWEYLCRQKWPDGTPVGVTLVVPVWVPSKAKQVATYRAKVGAIPVREQELTKLVRDYEMSKAHYQQASSWSSYLSLSAT